jgi:hypothetical protein
MGDTQLYVNLLVLTFSVLPSATGYRPRILAALRILRSQLSNAVLSTLNRLNIIFIIILKISCVQYDHFLFNVFIGEVNPYA